MTPTEIDKALAHLNELSPGCEFWLKFDGTMAVDLHAKRGKWHVARRMAALMIEDAKFDIIASLGERMLQEIEEAEMARGGQ